MKRVHTSLFGAHDGTDPIYNRLRNPAPKKSDTSEILARGRALSEELWSRTAGFLDSDLPDKATRQFHQCFWERYLAASLLDLNLALVPRAERKKPSVGPDLQVAPNIWLEAIAVTSGAGQDAVPDTTSGPANKAHDVPDEQITLRLISGITEKRNKFDSYRQNGIVGSDDVCIVALNAALVPPLNFEWFPPRIVRAVMEFGHPVVAMDRSSREIIERTNEHQATITKLSGSAVPQGLFRDGSCSSVSACLYSIAHFGFAPHTLGVDFVRAHNPTASVPLRRELFQRGRRPSFVRPRHLKRDIVGHEAGTIGAANQPLSHG